VLAQLLDDARAQARETRRSFHLKRNAKYRSISICGRWTKDKAGAVVDVSTESTDRKGRGTIFSLTWKEKFDPAKDVKKDEKPQVIELHDAVEARLIGLRSMVALVGVAGPPRSLSKGKSIMKLALTGIASVGILAVTVGAETANAQSYRRYRPARIYTPQAYPPQSRGSIPRGVPRTVPFSDPNSPEATGGGNIGYNHGLPDGGN
jgi:hypothetical protein